MLVPKMQLSCMVVVITLYVNTFTISYLQVYYTRPIDYLTK